MPRFAILAHDHPVLHWDFLLENGPVCRTWRVLRSPDSLGQIPAEVIPDHRLMYLDYEGLVSGDRGSVSAWDAGIFEWIIDQPDLVEVRLNGRVLKSVARLVRTDGETWAWSREASDTPRVV